MRKTLLLLACSFALVASAFAAEKRPNIIFILADDMGWEDAHCYGHPYAKTPNIDRLAAEGTRFQQFYATGVTCCPSRTGFMTSRHPASYQKYPAGGGFAGKPTITDLLHSAGYATGHVGKWHIGPDDKNGTYGIDEIHSSDIDPRGRGKQSLESRDQHIYDAAISFIEKHKDGPFYLNVWDHIPHYPVNPSQALIDSFGPLQVDESKFPAPMQEKFANCRKRGGDVSQHMRAWLAELKAMDDEIGRLLKRVDELGLRENTIIVFSSDQGPAPISDSADTQVMPKKQKKNAATGGKDSNELRLNCMGFAGPFRGGKHNQYEGGIRIPFIVRWPGHALAGRVDERSVISGIDWLPTLCGLTGTKFNAADFEGEDASAAWLGHDYIRTTPLFWKTSAPQSEGAIRDGQWKLHHPNSRRGEPELFDMAADPGEQHNLASEKPEVVKQLTARLEKWQATLPKSYDKSGDGDK